MNAPSRQVLKWIGNKHRVAAAIAECFPSDYGRYFEPFVGSAAVLGTLAPRDAWLVGEGIAATPAAMRERYRDYFCRRLRAPRRFAEEALRARAGV